MGPPNPSKNLGKQMEMKMASDKKDPDGKEKKQ